MPGTIEITLLPPLNKYAPTNGTVVVRQGDTVHALIETLGLDPQLVQLASLDGRFANFDTPLDNVKRVLLMPAIGGG